MHRRCGCVRPNPSGKGNPYIDERRFPLAGGAHPAILFLSKSWKYRATNFILAPWLTWILPHLNPRRAGGVRGPRGEPAVCGPDEPAAGDSATGPSHRLACPTLMGYTIEKRRLNREWARHCRHFLIYSKECAGGGLRWEKKRSMLCVRFGLSPMSWVLPAFRGL